MNRCSSYSFGALRSAVALLVVAAGVTVPLQSAQAIIVYDPSNYAQNVLSAARALRQINNQITSLQNEAQSLTNQAKNLSRIDFPELEALNRTLRQIEALMNEAQGIQFSTARVETQFDALYPDAFSQSLKLDDEVAAARTRLETEVQAYRHTTRVQAQIAETIEDDAQDLAKVAERSQDAEGALGAQQATNQLLAIAAKQQFQIQQLMAAQFRAEAITKANRAQASAQAQAATSRFLGSGKAYTPD